MHTVTIKSPPPATAALPNTPLYDMIRSWGRKPWNIVRKYIEHYTNEGDLVFDPFAGCGVATIEALKVKRRGIYNDLDPFLWFVAKTSAKPINIEDLKRAFEKLKKNILKRHKIKVADKEESIFEWIYKTKCECGAKAEISHIIWSLVYKANLSIDESEIERLRRSEKKREKLAYEALKIITEKETVNHKEVDEAFKASGVIDKLKTHPEEILKCIEEVLIEKSLVQVVGERPIEIIFVNGCPACGRKTKQPDNDDLNKLSEIERIEFSCFVPDGEMRYSNGQLFYKRRRVTKVRDLFTKRNLLALSIVKHEIEELDETDDIKDVLMLCFLAILEHVSKMQRPNKKGWGVETYWIPPTFLEQNVLRTLQNRFKIILKGKEEANKEIGVFFSESQRYKDIIKGEATAIFLQEDARDLPLDDECIDYIFTDPPYGDTIQYFELSFMHNEWLGMKAPFDQEIIVNPRQGKGDDRYRDMLIEAFKEAFRVLKLGKYMTVTFHSKDVRYWNALLYAIQLAGFTYVDAVYQAPQKEYTDWIHAQDPGRMSGDIYITFYKPEV